jgi:hypothetical protein
MAAFFNPLTGSLEDEEEQFQLQLEQLIASPTSAARQYTSPFGGGPDANGCWGVQWQQQQQHLLHYGGDSSCYGYHGELGSVCALMQQPALTWCASCTARLAHAPQTVCLTFALTRCCAAQIPTTQPRWAAQISATCSTRAAAARTPLLALPAAAAAPAAHSPATQRLR